MELQQHVDRSDAVACSDPDADPGANSLADTEPWAWADPFADTFANPLARTDANSATIVVCEHGRPLERHDRIAGSGDADGVGRVLSGR